jgi:Bacterial signalling protein N terminal repeat
MAAMRMPGRITCNPGLLIISVVIAIVAATAALWAAVRLRGLLTTLAASLVMGVAVSGMHYMGMAAMRMYAAKPVRHGRGRGRRRHRRELPAPAHPRHQHHHVRADRGGLPGPTEEEMRSESDVMQRIGKLRSEARLTGPAGSRPQ